MRNSPTTSPMPHGGAPSGSTATDTYWDLLKNLNFFKYWIGQLISYFGDRIDQMALFGLVSAAGAKAGGKQTMITFYALLPALLIGPWMGFVIDRVNRKWLLIVTDIYRGLLVLGMALFAHEQLDERAVYTVVFLVGCGTALFSPTKLAFLAEIVAPRQYMKANALSAASGTLTTLLGTFVGGLLVKYSGWRVSLQIDALTYFASTAMLFMIIYRPQTHARPIAAKPQSTLARTLKGIFYARNHSIVRRLFLFTFAQWWVSGMFYALSLYYVSDYKGWDEAALGILLGLLGVGMLVGGVVTGKIGKRWKKRYVLSIAMAAIGCLIFVTGRNWEKASLGTLFIAVGLAAGAMIVTMDTLYQKVIPNRIRGRIYTLSFVLVNGSLLGALWGTFSVMKAYGEPLFLMMRIAGLSLLVPAALVLMWPGNRLLGRGK